MAFKRVGFTVMAVLLAAGLTACGESDVVEEPSAKREEATTQLPEDAVVLTINQPVSEGDYRLVLVGVDSDSVDLRVSDRGGEEDSSSVDVGDSTQLLGLTLEVLSAGADSDFDEEVDGSDTSSATVRVVDVDEGFGTEIGDDTERVVSAGFEVRAGELWLNLAIEDDDSLALVAEDSEENLEAETDVAEGDEFELFDLHFEVLEIVDADSDFDDQPSVRVDILD